MASAWKASIGRYVQSVKLMACPTSPSSAAARNFYERNYTLVKHLNPTLPFMIREAPELDPYFVIEYDFNKKVKVLLGGMSESDIEKKVEEAVAVGKLMPRGKGEAGRELPAVIE